MTVLTDLYAVLGPLVGNRAYPDVAPADVARPYITYQRIGGQAGAFYGRTLPSKQHGMYQVNVWADTRVAAELLARQVEQALVGSTRFDCDPLSAPVDEYEEMMGLKGSRQDFSIWSDR